jgi:hypothetical protein
MGSRKARQLRKRLSYSIIKKLPQSNIQKKIENSGNLVPFKKNTPKAVRMSHVHAVEVRNTKNAV